MTVAIQGNFMQQDFALSSRMRSRHCGSSQFRHWCCFSMLLGIGRLVLAAYCFVRQLLLIGLMATLRAVGTFQAHLEPFWTQ